MFFLRPGSSLIVFFCFPSSRVSFLASVVLLYLAFLPPLTLPSHPRSQASFDYATRGNEQSSYMRCQLHTFIHSGIQETVYPLAQIQYHARTTLGAMSSAISDQKSRVLTCLDPNKVRGATKSQGRANSQTRQRRSRSPGKAMMRFRQELNINK